MIQKKICLLGNFAVGKTSLVRRYVDSLFSEEYQTTLGVKIDKKTLSIDGQKMAMILWDVQGEDHAQDILPAYLQGMAGYLLVVDPTREYTMTNAILLKSQINESLGQVPFVVALNKCDIKEQWDISDEVRSYLTAGALAVVETSAKSGEGVEECFEALASEFLPTASGATS
mgnify:CR=1 FL=1